MIQNIAIEKISPHYDNPRKELGDLTELAESIKNSGIFQNLTVVPWFSKLTSVGCDDPKQQEDMGYIVVIGHRRLAAAKLAGLTEVPCAISNMNYRDQIATMLLENMQRSDLTIYEQAEGFQMMLDLGESVDGISQKTGFSETTVRRRVKLLDLDKDKFKKSVERGATLMDYVELDKIKDTDLRNQVLEKIGTNNFNYELKNALDKEKTKENRIFIIAELEKFATLTTNSSGMRCISAYYPFEKKLQIKVPDDAGEAQYYFTTSEYGPMTLFKKLDDADAEAENTKNAAEEEKRKARKERNEALNYISAQAYQLRRNFISEQSNFTASKQVGTIIKYLLKEYTTGRYFMCPNVEDMAEYFDDIEISEGQELNFEDIKDAVTNLPERALLVLTYLTIENEGTYFDWDNHYKSNEKLDNLYDFLENVGYEMSDAEIALKNGTHSLFVSEEKE